MVCETPIIGTLFSYNLLYFEFHFVILDRPQNKWVNNSINRLPTFGFSIFCAGEASIITKKFLNVSETIFFVISIFFFSDGEFDSDIYKNYCRCNQFVYQKLFCSRNFWRFLLVFLFCCSVGCIVFLLLVNRTAMVYSKDVVSWNKTFCFRWLSVFVFFFLMIFFWSYEIQSSIYNFLEVVNSLHRCA